MQRFLRWQAEKNYSPKTIENREVYLRYFIQWCDERGLIKPPDITKPIIERYQRYLFMYRKIRDGEPLSTRSQHVRVVPIRAWFKWLAQQNYILYNPASDIEMLRLERRLPKHILTIDESEKIINQPNINNPLGIRDRAILETLYSTGIRRMELVNIKLFDIDTDRGTLMVRQGKGKKDRMIPIGDRALSWIAKYQNEVRPELTMPDDEGVLFLTNLSEAFTPNRLTQMVREYVDAADIGKRGSCHLFRHTMATLMLENGADVRFIQAMLGHVSLETTQIYTQVSIRKLKDIHTATHPAKLERTKNTVDQDEVDGEALLSALAAEEVEEHADSDD
ncbi:MAG TPA: site-specific tyrosine recombinase XerC [Crenotrichaceae bacterium]|nr:site-specific tyrosine recombinase XerC [Crenotrichaceae bacterium]